MSGLAGKICRRLTINKNPTVELPTYPAASVATARYDQNAYDPAGTRFSLLRRHPWKEFDRNDRRTHLDERSVHRFVRIMWYSGRATKETIYDSFSAQIGILKHIGC